MNERQTDDKATPPEAMERTGRRERIFNMPFIVAAIVALLIGIHVLRVYVLTPDQDIDLLLRGAFIPLRYSGGYDLDIYALTSPVTYSLLHGGVEHLAVNLIWLVAFGSPLAQRLGPARFILFWVAASVAAAALHFAVHPMANNPLIGASGAIAGMMGAAARFGFQVDRSGTLPAFSGPVLPIGAVLSNRGVLFFLLVWLAANTVTGLYSLTPDGGGIAWEAHVGGFVLGFFGIGLFVKRHATWTRRD